MLDQLLEKQKLTYSKIFFPTKDICNLFSNNYNRLSKAHNLEPASLNGKKLRIFFDGDDQMIGGYVINENPDYQYLISIPEEKKKYIENQYGFDNFIEITGIWMNQKMKKHKRPVNFYTQAFLDCCLSDKEWILGGSYIPKVRDMHMKCLPYILHTGEKLFGDQEKEYWVYYGSLNDVINAIPEFCNHLINT